MHILLSCLEKILVTKEILLAAARNPQTGSEVLSLLTFSFGNGILPEFVTSTGIDCSSGFDVAVLLLQAERYDNRALISENLQPPNIALEFTKA